jgi:hypothetical protein
VQKWQFGQTLNLQWYWRRLHDDGTSLDSSRTFGSRVECIADAFENGYCSSPAGQSNVLPKDLPPALDDRHAA